MTSYKERMVEVISDSEVGLTTVDVAKKAGVSKTTVIKYLSVLRSEGQVEFVEVGPSKLWRIKGSAGKSSESEGRQPEARLEIEALPMVDIDLCNGDDKTIHFSFRMKPEQVCDLMKRARKCVCKMAEDTF
ncbi:MAG TPA: FaeA/PapI family transcriptional regulator [Methanotrichaceae archaeon]|nr:FaeA/PapI family transcriptional regulator [Methanotrichaceae archaeon]